MADHHASHAFYAHVDSRFGASLVVSYDGGGNDGTFLVRYAVILWPLPFRLHAAGSMRLAPCRA